MKEARRTVAYVAAGLLGLGAGGTALAHHSNAMFDHHHQVSITGTVSKFEWTSPHIWIFVDVPMPNGSTQTWAIETNDPSGMSRQGWNKHFLNDGDHVTITLAPRKDGEPSGFLYTVTLPDGRVVKGGGAPPEFGADTEERPSASPAPAPSP